MSESKKIAQLRDRLANIENNSTQPLSELSLPPGAAALATKVGTKALDLGADAVQGVKKFFTKPPPTLSQTSQFTLNGKDYFAQPGLGGNGIKWFRKGANNSEIPVTNPTIISQLEAEAAKHGSNLVQGVSSAGKLWANIKSLVPEAKKTQEAQEIATKLKSKMHTGIRVAGGITVSAAVGAVYKAYETDDAIGVENAVLVGLAGVAGVVWPPKTLIRFATFVAAILLVAAGGLARSKNFTDDQNKEILDLATKAWRAKQEPNKEEIDKINPNYYDVVKALYDKWKRTTASSTSSPSDQSQQSASTGQSQQSAPLASPRPSSSSNQELDDLIKDLKL
jgi:hypothetical protein